MTPSRHEQEVLAHLEQDISTTAPRLARRLASQRRGRVRQFCERAFVAVGWTFIALGVIVLFSFPDEAPLVETSLAAIGIGLLAVTARAILRALADSIGARYDQAPRTGGGA